MIFPALMAALITVGGGVPADEGGKLDFKIDLQDPPPCLTGFVPPTEIRSPADKRCASCRPTCIARRRRTIPPWFAAHATIRARSSRASGHPTVQLCRDPKGYVPIGTNPWRGPPVPYGTPIEDPRMILPQNKFPYIPPQVDPDPGPPVVQLPPGVPPGPGPAPHAPFPLPVPPNDNGPPPPLPYYAPPDQVVPPYGRPAPEAPPAPPAPPTDGGQPLPAEAPLAWGHHPPEGQGDGPSSIATYDQNGKFVDPDGGTGVYAPGADKLAPAENWVDLMLAPRQA